MAFRQEITRHRKKIDECDAHIVQAHGQLITSVSKNPLILKTPVAQILMLSVCLNMAKRFTVTDKVGHIKLKYGIPSVIQPEREQQVYDNVVELNSEFEPLVGSDLVLGVWKSIHTESVRRQEEQKLSAQTDSKVA